MIISKLFQSIVSSRLYLCILSLAFLGCSDSSILNEYKDLESGYWAYNEPATFEFNIQDTTVNYSIDYYIRNSMEYEFYNLYVAYSIVNAHADTIRNSMHESNLVDPTTGIPFGSTAGDYYDHTISLFNDIHFKDTGQYRLTMHQYMRKDTLDNIHAVGLRVVSNQLSK